MAIDCRSCGVLIVLLAMAQGLDPQMEEVHTTALELQRPQRQMKSTIQQPQQP